ncbi:MAG TPA: alcohol dehydrogenase catalytic domain-containing protein [Solirubrobacteraceae bacterium]|jgi:S-(hydroxymethyl)glutathione dehydrogenase/alcohol dehydrogenase|nr:alcohol dehydrogenase catalytic domain-containing protein [Solirubrobacteraceae bacterium]
MDQATLVDPLVALPASLSMEAVVLREPGRPPAVETVLLDAPHPDEVLVRVAAAGVCHSDVHMADGKLGAGRWPVVLGHEGAGVVQAVGAQVTGLRAGDHVVFSIVPSCGSCVQCRSGRPTLCEPAGRNITTGTLLDGTSRLRGADGSTLQHGFMVGCFAQYAVVPAAGALRISSEIPLWQAALVGCAAVTGFGAVRRAGVSIGDTVCVIGCGGVGLQVIVAAHLAGASRIIAVDRGEDKLERARHQGATHTVDAETEDVVEATLAISGGVDRAFEVIGRPDTIRQAWDVLRLGGTAVVVGLAPAGTEVSLAAIQFLGERTITGSYYGSGDVGMAVDRIGQFVTDGRLDLTQAISHVAPLAGVPDALERLRRGEGARTVIIVDEPLAGRAPGDA